MIFESDLSPCGAWCRPGGRCCASIPSVQEASDISGRRVRGGVDEETEAIRSVVLVEGPGGWASFDISPKLLLAELCAIFEKSSMRILRGEALGCGRSRGSRAECPWKVPASLTSSTPHRAVVAGAQNPVPSVESVFVRHRNECGSGGKDPYRLCHASRRLWSRRRRGRCVPLSVCDDTLPSFRASDRWVHPSSRRPAASCSREGYWVYVFPRSRGAAIEGSGLSYVNCDEIMF